MSSRTDNPADVDDTQDGAIGRTPGTAATSGQLLRHYRQLARLTQEELAERSGYSANYISKLERDQRQPPPAAIERLAEVLGLEAAQRDALGTVRPQEESVQWKPDGAPLVGRHAELAGIDRHLAGGEPPILLFAGEPGIGKTRLLEEAAARAAATGWRVVRGGCQPWAQDPYAPLTDALAQSIHALPERERAATLKDSAWLGLLLPELAHGNRGATRRADGVTGQSVPAFSPEQEHRLLVSGVSRYLRGVAGPAGILLVLDDLQWAGADALTLLATLIASAEAPPIRLIGAYRDTDVAAHTPLGRLVADLARVSLVRVLSLDPLSGDEAQELLADLVDDGDDSRRALLPAIARRAGGVPFFLVSYVEDLRLRPGPASPSLELPWTVAQVIRQRVVALPGRTPELLRIAAVIGRVVPRSLLTRVAGVGEEEVLSGLEAAAAVRLLEEQGESDYRFPHDVIRETVELDLSSGRRQLLHRRIGEALEEGQGADVDALAYHFARSDDGPRALRYLELAGNDAQHRFAHVAAANFYREAVVRLDRLGRAPEAAPIRERLAAALLMSAQYGEAIEVLDRASTVYRETDDDEGVRRVAGRIATVSFRRGGGRDTIDQVLALAEEGEIQGRSSPGSVTLRQGLFRLLFARGAYKQMLTSGRAAARLGRATRNSRLEVMGEVTQGLALIFLGRLSEGVPMVERAIPKVLAAGEHQALAESVLALHGAHLAMGALQRNRALSEQMLPIAQNLQDPVIIACHSAVLGTTLHALGYWGAGRAYLNQAEELFAGVEPSALAIRTIGFRAPPLLWEGDWEGARRFLEAALQLAHAMHVAPSQRSVLSSLAELDLLQGDPEAAVARLAPLADAELEWGYAIPVLSTLAWAYLEVGELARAEPLAQRAVAWASRTGTWLPGISALRIQGMIATRLERYDVADAAYGEGLRRARAMPFPYGEAQLLLASGLLDRQRGNDRRAGEQMEEALGIFQRLGAGKDIERVRGAIEEKPPK